MVFESFSEANSALLWSTFVIAVVMGAVVNKTNFCTMGAVSDAVNMGDWGRMRAWFFAIAVALLGVSLLEASSLADPDNAFPPYRMGQLIWAENLLGGLVFGIGMTLASGCGNKTLIRIGGGNIKSLMVFLIIGVIAYFMVNPLPGSDQTLMSLLFLDWIRPLAIDMGGPQDLGSVLAGESAGSARLWIGVALAAVLMFFVFKSAEFRGSFDNVLGGLVVGAAVLAAWYVSSNIMLQYEDWGDKVTVSTREFLDPVASSWDMAEDARANWDAAKPDMTSMSPQSFTFINPMGQSVGYTAKGFDRSDLSFGVIAVFGIIIGSFLWAIISKGFRIEWFSSVRDFFNHFIGAIMMGFGGVLAMGCTIGQGITGVSTLAIGSIITLVSIILGSALTMKVQYYKLVYEEEASFAKALVAGLCDMKLLPNGLRQLDKV
ncbi:MAG: YeeE/YedE family protein [Gammaproteobacteria bacterium]|nr:YeeE/YedE family protein [Gammaproteobacteria bacterium]